MTAPTPTFRAILATGATIAGLVAVLGISPAGRQLASSAEGVEAVEETSAESATTPLSDQGPASPGEGASDSSSADSSSTGSPSAGSTASSEASDGTYTGSAYQSPYGAMQVEVTILGGAISDIAWVQLPTDHHSQRINQQAAPTLVSEALAAQSAQVDSISGASFTSEGFKESLQSALDQAGFHA
ncbi:FMN-binding protein [Schaalia hyovaginalis]|uniref:FMN-binding protein n=1 Tax=Schaalia hyovaginalis TaxID=29316 RepID=UPI0026ECD2BD|nr:FMN-binding protein [Schaalia hyovaginalis]MCI6411631.1 FMN-binding protein [Schaalia hyovaginalis]